MGKGIVAELQLSSVINCDRRYLGGHSLSSRKAWLYNPNKPIDRGFLLPVRRLLGAQHGSQS
jgi:hypothetical protein